MIRYFILLLIMFSALGFILNGQAVSDSLPKIELGEVMVSATRSLSNIENIPIKIHVINKRQIEENQPLTPVEALQYIPGITRQSDGGLASTPIIRGLSRERAPLLVDGNAYVGGRIRSYALIDPFQIERIEVVKGPGSAFWGSDAVSGLVNIVTRKAEDGYGKKFKLGGSVYGGYQSVADFYRGRLELEGRGNGIDFLIGGGIRNAGNTKTSAGEIQNSQFESTNFDFNIGYSFAANHRLEISGKYFENNNVGFPGGLGAPGPPNVVRRFDPDIQKDLNLAYDAHNIYDKIESIGFRMFYKEQNLHVDQITRILFPNSDILNRRIHAILDVDVPFMGGKFFVTLKQRANAKLTVGLDYLREHRIGTHRDLNVQIFNRAGTKVNEINRPYTQIQPDSYSNSIGIFAIEEIKLNQKFDLLLAGRLDNVSTRIEDGPFDIASIAEAFNSENTSDSDLKATGNIGVKFQASKAFSFTANVANSFRGTDLFSKYHFAEVGQGFLVPNPNLNSETGLFYELGAKYKFGRLTIEANYFQNYLNNLFDEANIVFEDRPSVQNQNIGKARLTGFEWDARVRIGALSSIFISGATIKGTNEVTNKPLQSIPATQLWAGVHLQERSEKFFIRPEMLMVLDQNNPAPNEIKTPGYAIFNINTGLNLHNISSKLPHSRFIFSITNLTDKLYRSHVSSGAPGNQNVFMEPGRSFNLGFVTRIGGAIR